jgi:hypothetical protein
MGPANDRAHDAATTHKRWTEPWQANDRHVPKAELCTQQAQVDLHEPVARVEHHQSLDALGPPHRGDERHIAAPIVAREQEALDPERIAHRQ